MSHRPGSDNRRLVGWIVALSILTGAPSLFATETAADARLKQQLHLPVDFTSAAPNADGDQSSAAVEAGRQPIVAPLPPAVLTAVPVLAGIWATHRCRAWRRRLMR